MPTEPVFFVVERRAGREFPAVIHDRLPERLTRKGSRLLAYAVRLDRLENGAALAEKPVAELYATYKKLAAAGKLPQNTADPPRQTPGTRAAHGEWYFPPSPPGYGLPAEPFPDPDAIKPRPDAPAATFSKDKTA